MKNAYEIRGNETAIFLKRRDGSIIETIIDTEDLKFLQLIDISWSANFSKITNSFYVVGNLWNGEFREDGVKKFISIKLHRVITRAQKDDVVDHINHDTLCNIKSNLRNVDKLVNNMNRKSNNKNSSSGIRGVSLKRQSNQWKWCARIGLGYKRIHIGYFDTKEEAEIAITEARKKLA